MSIYVAGLDQRGTQGLGPTPFNAIRMFVGRIYECHQLSSMIPRLILQLNTRVKYAESVIGLAQDQSRAVAEVKFISKIAADYLAVITRMRRA